MGRRSYVRNRMVVLLLARFSRISLAWSNLPTHTKTHCLRRRGRCTYRCVSAASAAAVTTGEVRSDASAPGRFSGGDAPASKYEATADERRPGPPRRFVDYPFAYHQELILEIESLTNRGWGIGRVVLPVSTSAGPPPASSSAEDADPDFVSSTDVDKKWVVMVVPGVIPGEIAKVRIFRNFNTYSEADVVEVLEHHDQRTAPRCPVFMDCGGCQYQHMDIDLQRYWKTRHVQEALDQYQVRATALPCLGTAETYGYRSKLTPHYQAPTLKKGGQREDEGQSQLLAIQQIGFQRQTSRQIVDVDQCVIATDPINAAYARIREKLLSQDLPCGSSKNKGATLLLRQGNAEDPRIVTRHLEPLTTPVLGMNFTYLAGNFFQNNYYVLPLMVQHVVDAAAATLPMNEQSPSCLVDCYCGSGLFAISAASRFESIVGIEINDRAVQEATDNAAQNHLDNCRFVSASAERIFLHLDDNEGSEMARDRAVVILDPPRKGCSDSFLEQLLQFGPARVVYLSCDPVTQARDLAVLLQSNEATYEIDFVQPFDLFPQTRHIECLVVLNRQKPRQELN